MKILHIGTFLQGGAGRILVDLAIEQQRTGHAVSVVLSKTTSGGYEHYPAHLEELHQHAIPVQLLDSTSHRDTSANMAVVDALEAAIPAGTEPEVIHTHATTPSVIAALFAGVRRRPIALVQTIHGSELHEIREHALDVTVLNRVDCVTVPAQKSAQLLESLGVGRSRVEVVPFAIRRSCAPLEPNDEEAVLKLIRARRAGTFVVACVGRVGERKNQRLLVEAIRLLPPNFRIHVIFVGEGELDALAAAADTLGVSDRIQILGYRRAARRIAAMADAMVLPSRSEGQPLALLEAFQDGTLVITSDIAELKELVTDGITGFSFEAGNAAALANRLVQVAALPNPSRHAIRALARARHVEQFSTSAMARRYDEVYASARGGSVDPIRPLVVPAA